MKNLVKMIRDDFEALVEPHDVEAWRADGYRPVGEAAAKAEPAVKVHDPRPAKGAGKRKGK